MLILTLLQQHIRDYYLLLHIYLKHNMNYICLRYIRYYMPQVMLSYKLQETHQEMR